jgi:hypothetical protein
MDSLLVTFDVVSLYPSIKIRRLLQILQDVHNIPDAVISAISFACSFNYFKYRTRLYKQCEGIAMGLNCAPQLANIYLAHAFDELILNNINIIRYFRFIDDGLLIWSGSRLDLLAVLNQLNNIIPGISITYNISTTTVDFLDLKLTKDNNKIIISTHQKSLNNYLYLLPFSHHPRPCLRGFIKGELIRYLRTNTQEYSFLLMKSKFKARLIARGFDLSFLASIFNNINYNIRHLYTQIQRRDFDTTCLIVPLIIRYERTINQTNFIKSIKSLDNQLATVFPHLTVKSVLAIKKTPNCSDLISCSKITPNQEEHLLSNYNQPW